MKEIFILHNVPKKNILDGDAKFTSNVWKVLFVVLEHSWILVLLIIPINMVTQK